MIIKELISSVIIGTTILYIYFWDVFQFSIYNQFLDRTADIQETILSSVVMDQGLSLIIIRLFHNKLVYLFFETFENIIRLFDPFVIGSIVGIIGAAVFYLGVIYVLTSRYSIYFFFFLLLVSGFLVNADSFVEQKSFQNFLFITFYFSMIVNGIIFLLKHNFKT